MHGVLHRKVGWGYRDEREVVPAGALGGGNALEHVLLAFSAREGTVVSTGLGLPRSRRHVTQGVTVW
jgi:hypothetical protein